MMCSHTATAPTAPEGIGDHVITLHTLDSDASREAFLAARKALRAFVTSAEAYAAEAPDEESAAEARTIAEALRDDSLTRLSGRAPAAPIRHLPNMSPGVRRLAPEVLGVEYAEALCPVLAADGVTPSEAQALRVRNGRSNADVRATSERCPACLALDVVRTLRRDGAEARDAAALWNRRGA